jgi:2-dehydro-3-deoxy-L-rhamnonate dehydrogenase (NAD+)
MGHSHGPLSPFILKLSRLRGRAVRQTSHDLTRSWDVLYWCEIGKLARASVRRVPSVIELCRRSLEDARRHGMNKIDLTNRHAIVTGGAQGIGLSIARRFLASGASVTLCDRDTELLAATVRELNGRGTVDAVTADVTDTDAVIKAAASTAEKFGKIDILVANAGISGPNLKAWEYPVETWKQIIDVDLTGVFLCCRAVVPFMLQQKYGRIVNVSSIAGKEGNPNACAYSAAKAGVIALTKSLGKELADRNIAVNCITPAAARTRIFDQMSQEHVDYMLSRIPRGRFLELDEVAAMVAWLVSEENSFTTGAVFDLSGGRATY